MPAGHLLLQAAECVKKKIRNDEKDVAYPELGDMKKSAAFSPVQFHLLHIGFLLLLQGLMAHIES